MQAYVQAVKDGTFPITACTLGKSRHTKGALVRIC